MTETTGGAAPTNAAKPPTTPAPAKQAPKRKFDYFRFHSTDTTEDPITEFGGFEFPRNVWVEIPTDETYADGGEADTALREKPLAERLRGMRTVFEEYNSEEHGKLKGVVRYGDVQEDDE